MGEDITNTGELSSSSAEPDHRPPSKHRFGYIIGAIIALGVVIVAALTVAFGARAQQTYLDSLRQIRSAGADVTVQSYQRGWFSSQAVFTVGYGPQRMVFRQVIHHGPLGFVGWLPVFPVAAVIDTEVKAPPNVTEVARTIFGDVQPSIVSIAKLNGTIDTELSVPPSTFSSHGFTVKSSGLEYQTLLDQGSMTMSGSMAQITGTRPLAEWEISGITLRGQSHQAGPGIWIGSSRVTVDHSGFTFGSNSGENSPSAMINRAVFSVNQALNSSNDLNLEWSLSVENIQTSSLNLGPVVFKTDITNLPPSFLKRYEQVRPTPPKVGDHGQIETLNAKQLTLFKALLKNSPQMALGLTVENEDQKAIGNAKLGVDEAFMKDKALQTLESNPRQYIAMTLQRYGYATADFSAPRAFFLKLTSENKLVGWEKGGILKRDGANDTCHIAYKDSELLLNGKKLKVPPAAGRTL